MFEVRSYELVAKNQQLLPASFSKSAACMIAVDFYSPCAVNLPVQGTQGPGLLSSASPKSNF
jgi:hypothetical protein